MKGKVAGTIQQRTRHVSAHGPDPGGGIECHRMNIQLSNQIILIEATNVDLQHRKHQGQSYFEEMRNFILELKAHTQ